MNHPYSNYVPARLRPGFSAILLACSSLSAAQAGVIQTVDFENGNMAPVQVEETGPTADASPATWSLAREATRCAPMCKRPTGGPKWQVRCAARSGA